MLRRFKKVVLKSFKGSFSFQILNPSSSLGDLRSRLHRSPPPPPPGSPAAAELHEAARVRLQRSVVGRVVLQHAAADHEVLAHPQHEVARPLGQVRLAGHHGGAHVGGDVRVGGQRAPLDDGVLDAVEAVGFHAVHGVFENLVPGGVRRDLFGQIRPRDSTLCRSKLSPFFVRLAYSG